MRLTSPTRSPALHSKGFLINVARGKLVDEAALVRALADGTIAYAWLAGRFERIRVTPDA
nr:NAD(P)-dependent oxidoreductase [Burkholderia sp. BCC1998]